MVADIADFVIAHIGVEDLGQDGELALARELFVIKIRWVDDDCVPGRLVYLFPDLGLDCALQLNITLQ